MVINILVGIVISWSVNNHINIPVDYTFKGKIGPAYSGVRTSPGIEVGVTYLDWQTCGSMSKHIHWPTPLGGFHFSWTYMTSTGGATRRVYYNYFLPPSQWLGPTQVDPLVSRYGALDCLEDGRAVCTSHRTREGAIRPTFYIDASEGAGNFTIIEIPTGNLPTNDLPLYPQPFVDTIHHRIWISGHQVYANFGWVTYTDDEGLTWADWTDTLGGVPLNENYFNGCDRPKWAVSPEGKVALISNDGYYLDYHYWETTDNGTTWTHNYVWQHNFPTDSVIGYICCDAVYDNNNNLHVVFTVIDTIGQSNGGSGWRSQIRHWNQATGQVSIVASGWYEVYPGPGANHPTVSECQIGINRVTGDLYCTWCQADSNDTAQSGLANLDIWGARSTDDGLSWIEHHNITNSHTPGAPPGQCDDDRNQCLNSEVKDGGAGPDTLYLFYLNSKDAGGGYFPPDPGAVMTEDPFLFYAYAWSVGIEENKNLLPVRFGLNVSPIPACNHMNITYTIPAADNISIRLYRVDGRLSKIIEQGYRDAGVYKLRFNTGEIPNGVYIIILKGTNQEITAKLVVTH
ncbi:MAG: T9SS type A sorting domain-containing protein [candidate division WOR-3 bacterium]